MGVENRRTVNDQTVVRQALRLIEYLGESGFDCDTRRGVDTLGLWDS